MHFNQSPSLQLTSLVLITLCPIILSLPSPVFQHSSSHSSYRHHRRFTQPKNLTNTDDATTDMSSGPASLQSPQNLTSSSGQSNVPLYSSAPTTYTPIQADEKYDLTKASTWEELERMAEAQISASITTLPTTVQLEEVPLSEDDFLEECEDEEDDNYVDVGSTNLSDANPGEDNNGQTSSDSIDDWTEVPINSFASPLSPSKSDQSNGKDDSVVKGTTTAASQKADQDAASKKAKDAAAAKASQDAQQAQDQSDDYAAQKKANYAAQKKSDDEAAQQKSDEEAAQKKSDEQEAKKEADAKKKADEEYAQKQSDEADAKQKAEEEQAKKHADEAEAEAKKKADEEQAKQSDAEAEAKKKADEQAKKDAAAAQSKADESKDKDQGSKDDGDSGSYTAPADSKSGDATYYGTGLGACGVTNNDQDYICAVSKLLFDTFPAPGGNPNLNEICGRKIHATYKGKTVTVTVTDRCEACAVHDLDFAPAAFDQIGSRDEGRLHGMTWTWA